MFHRLTNPSYVGGLPGGYDYINNGSAPADGAKVGGPNAGTYFHAFGEDATSVFFNRPAQALAQNTDYLDDLFHRDLAVVVRTDPEVAMAPVTSIEITGAGIFLGTDVGTPLNLLFEITDENDVQISDASGQPCVVASISGPAVGDGFSIGLVTLNVSPAIPVGRTYRVYYGRRSNLAVVPAGGLAAIGVRGMREKVPGVFAAAGFQAARQPVTIAGSGVLGVASLSWASMWYDINGTYTGATHQLSFAYSGTLRAGAVYVISVTRTLSCTITNIAISASGITNRLSTIDSYLQPISDAAEVRDLYVGYAVSPTEVDWSVVRL